MYVIFEINSLDFGVFDLLVAINDYSCFILIDQYVGLKNPIYRIYQKAQQKQCEKYDENPPKPMIHRIAD